MLLSTSSSVPEVPAPAGPYSTGGARLDVIDVTYRRGLRDAVALKKLLGSNPSQCVVCAKEAHQSTEDHEGHVKQGKACRDCAFPSLVFAHGPRMVEASRPARATNRNDARVTWP